MKKITKSFLKKHNACESGYKWYLEQKTTDAKEILKRFIEQNRLSDANWLISRILSQKDKIRYAIYASEQVIHIYEKICPENKAPRLAIESAKLVLKMNTQKNRAAAGAAWAAARDAGDDARDAARDPVLIKIIKFGISLFNF